MPKLPDFEGLAVFAKVAILIAVILFLQRRPAGLFATRGRGAEA